MAEVKLLSCVRQSISAVNTCGRGSKVFYLLHVASPLGASQWVPLPASGQRSRGQTVTNLFPTSVPPVARASNSAGRSVPLVVGTLSPASTGPSIANQSSGLSPRRSKHIDIGVFPSRSHQTRVALLCTSAVNDERVARSELTAPASIGFESVYIQAFDCQRDEK